jgi:hypothetical protein
MCKDITELINSGIITVGNTLLNRFLHVDDFT